MVYIKISNKEGNIVLDCTKSTPAGEKFMLVIDPETMEIIEKPETPDLDVSAAYSRIRSLLKQGKPLPKETTAEWG